MILEFVKNHLYFLGLLHLPTNGTDQVLSTHIRSCLVFISLGIFIVPTFCYFLFEAATFAEYVNSFFFTMCGLLGASFNAVLLWEKSNITQLIAKLEEIFNKRRNFLAKLLMIYRYILHLKRI